MEAVMHRRVFLTLAEIGAGVLAIVDLTQLGGSRAAAQTPSVPTVDRLVMTNVVDNVYDIFAKGGRLDAITVQRAPLAVKSPLLAEHGLAYHLESIRGSERREILLDFSLTEL